MTSPATQLSRFYTWHGAVTQERGRANEARLLVAALSLAREPGSHVLSARAATPEEDARGIDVVAVTRHGEVPLQAKSSWGGAASHMARPDRRHIPVVVVSLDDGVTLERARAAVLSYGPVRKAEEALKKQREMVERRRMKTLRHAVTLRERAVRRGLVLPPLPEDATRGQALAILAQIEEASRKKRPAKVPVPPPDPHLAALQRQAQTLARAATRRGLPLPTLPDQCKCETFHSCAAKCEPETVPALHAFIGALSATLVAARGSTLEERQRRNREARDAALRERCSLCTRSGVALGGAWVGVGGGRLCAECEAVMEATVVELGASVVRA